MTPSIDCYWVGAVPNLNPKSREANPNCLAANPHREEEVKDTKSLSLRPGFTFPDL